MSNIGALSSFRKHNNASFFQTIVFFQAKSINSDRSLLSRAYAVYLFARKRKNHKILSKVRNGSLRPNITKTAKRHKILIFSLID